MVVLSLQLSLIVGRVKSYTQIIALRVVYEVLNHTLTVFGKIILFEEDKRNE